MSTNIKILEGYYSALVDKHKTGQACEYARQLIFKHLTHVLHGL